MNIRDSMVATPEYQQLE
jgi:hypothetical protein